ncbi:MAG: hypothetical protein AAF340_04840 [Pseudomonadota bacterium]
MALFATRFLLVAAGLLLLAGCSGDFPGLGALTNGTATSGAEGQKEITVTSNQVSLTAPEGFCVDPVSTRNGASEAFVVFGNCAAITGNNKQSQPYVEAIVTATVSSAGLAGDGSIAPQSEALVGFFQSNAGKQALSRSADPRAVRIGDGFSEDGAVFLLVADSSPPHVDGAMKSYWRSYFDAGSAVVAMSVIGFQQNPISGTEGLSLLRRFKERNARAPFSKASQEADAQRPVQRPG